MARPYAEAEYRAASAYLAANLVACAWPGCSARATSPDHVPALCEHDHVAGSGCCALRPLCLSHNASAGARVGNRRRRARSRSRLAPGSAFLDRDGGLYPAAIFVLSPPVKPRTARKSTGRV